MQSEQSKYKAVWLSDIHLGYKDCKSEFLLDFLAKTQCEYLFLVGDIVDLWSMKRQVFWPKSHQQVLDALLAKAADGCNVIYVPGNHDEPMRNYDGSMFQGIELHREYEYNSISYGKLLMLHGDEFDGAVKYSKINTWFGDMGYDLLLFINRWVNRCRSWFGFSYWSAASYLKKKVRKAEAAIRRFEDAAMHEAKKRGVDGIVCGHIHSPNMRYENGILYLNDGDWVESCTAAVEHESGQIELLHWSNTHKLINHLPADLVIAGRKAA
ncbi:UDP-2,3-diacylglucosamine diphosphatase [Echinimonas agarilytica]|uniref:UDP-2,3-diacylglucosamine diphosphatase n=1 Tax=Echinimonas agarilytica TaxID=1215918 RepID=A0AA42B8I3_9GAMM|nr:UDP-2,3-diacylglucosamine diphosphatase [Echinimonas agarilytica]MCM2680588.1 UDP-2,3-diacylglucosamine diphosphatase [Echinimonas agarilytica]